MAYCPNDIASETTVDNTTIQQNFDALDTAISGNLTEANLSSATRIPNSKLASSNVEEVIALRYCSVGGFSAPGQAPGGTTVKDIQRLSGSGVYTVVGASYVVNTTTATTAGSTTVTVEAGSYVAGVWTATSTLVAAVAVAGQGSVAATQGDFTLSGTTITAPSQIAFRFPAAGTSHVLNMIITLRLTRSLQ